MSRALLFITFLLIIFQSFGQEKTREQHFMLSGAYGYGNVLITDPFLRINNAQNKPIDRYQFASLHALWQNPGYADWQKVLNFPYYGAGIAVGDFFTEEIGYPISAYGILGVPLKRWKKVEAYAEFQVGLTGNWNHFDEETNRNNISVSTDVSAYLVAYLKAFYQFNQRIEGGLGIGLIHSSNGAVKVPNFGLNAYAPSLELRYRFKERANYQTIDRLTEFKREKSLYVMLAYSRYQSVLLGFDSNNFSMFGLSAVYLKQVKNMLRIGPGLDINYLPDLNLITGESKSNTLDDIAVGVVLQPEILIGDLTFVTGVGVYVKHLAYGSFQKVYQRMGLKYRVYDNLSLGVNVRANDFSLADFLEFNVGYTIPFN